MGLKEKLNMIIVELKAPKGQYNSFGKYKYRSCEDILEGLKPLFGKYKCFVIIKDEIVMVGDRYYIKANITLYDSESEDFICGSAMAREEENKKGMDGAQVTGSTSSYARKYALNGMFCIDDTKDADTDEFTSRTKPDFKKKDSAESTAPKFIGRLEKIKALKTYEKEVLEKYNTKFSKKATELIHIPSAFINEQYNIYTK